MALCSSLVFVEGSRHQSTFDVPSGTLDPAKPMLSSRQDTLLLR